MMNKLFSVGLAATVLAAGVLGVQAHAYTPEASLLKIKGYSPQLNDAILTQRSRQEWKTPPERKRTPKQQLLHNIYNNDWFGNIDEFGYGVIREH